MNKQYIILRGRFRMLFGFCPNCNSDTPELYMCEVCNYNQEPKHNWWKFFKLIVGGK